MYTGFVDFVLCAKSNVKLVISALKILSTFGCLTLFCVAVHKNIFVM